MTAGVGDVGGDTTPPTATVVINGDATWTNSRSVTASLTATDDLSGVTEMRYAINGYAEAQYSPWEPFATTKVLQLPSWQGANYVNFQVRDAAGNVTWVWDSIALDMVAPTANLQINQGAAMTNSRIVSLALTAADANSGLAEMRFAINGQAEEKYSAWEPFAATKALTLPNWQGTNWVNVQVRDRAGNVRLAYRSIILDTVAPTVSFNINGGVALTNSRTVNLGLTATDATSGVADMRFAINSQAEEKYSAWEPFATTKTLTLPNWQGANWVNMQVRDRAGNVRFAYRSIVLDTVAPTVAQAALAADSPVTETWTVLSVLGADASGEAKLVYTWTVSAMPSGAPAPSFSINSSNAAKSTQVTFSQAGTYAFTATIADPAGLSVSSSATVSVLQSLTSIQVTPGSAAVTIQTTRQFAAQGLDQFGRPLTSQPAFTWTVGGGGTVDYRSGLFTAPGLPAVSTVTSAAGAVTGTATATVVLGLNDLDLDLLTATRFANDSRIDRTEMLEILRSTGADDQLVDAYEFADLKAILNKASLLQIPGYARVLADDVVNGNPANARYQGQTLGNLAAGSSATQLNMLVDKWFLGADRPAAAFPYQSFAGSLFVNNPTYTDMNQGGVGDCYLIAALGAIAKSSPAAIENIFIDNGDDTWTVRLYVGTTADYLTVDRLLPALPDGSPAYHAVGGGRFSNPANELWLALAEKAYAQWNETGRTGRSNPENSYASISSGWMDTVSNQVLGNAATTYWWLPDSHKQYLIAGIRENKAVTYATKKAPGNGLAGPHAYVVTGYDSTNDTFQLYNPWGDTHPGPLTYSQLRNSGQCFTIADAWSTLPPTGLPSGAAVGQTPILSQPDDAGVFLWHLRGVIIADSPFRAPSHPAHMAADQTASRKMELAKHHASFRPSAPAVDAWFRAVADDESFQPAEFAQSWDELSIIAATAVADAFSPKT